MEMINYVEEVENLRIKEAQDKEIVIKDIKAQISLAQCKIDEAKEDIELLNTWGVFKPQMSIKIITDFRIIHYKAKITCLNIKLEKLEGK